MEKQSLQKSWDKYFSLRNQLVDNKIDELSTHIINGRYEEYRERNELIWFKEYASINLDFGRQTGKTWWHASFLNDHCSKYNVNTISIFSNTSMKRYFTDKYYNRLLYRDNHFIFSKDEPKYRIKEKLRAVSVEYVIIDVATVLSKGELNNLMYMCMDYNPKLFILL